MRVLPPPAGNDRVGNHACQPTTFNQPCDWRASPDLLRERVQVLAHGALDADYPLACAAGLRGSAHPFEQMTSTCGGACPAG